MSDSDIRPTEDVKVGILSSDEHIRFLLQGQVLSKVRENLIFDLANDDMDIEKFEKEGGTIITPSEKSIHCVIQLGDDNILIQTPVGDDMMTCLSVPSGLPEKTQAFEDALIAFRDRYASDNALSGAWTTLNRNQQNYDYLIGLDDMLKKIKSDPFGAVKILFSQAANDSTPGGTEEELF